MICTRRAGKLYKARSQLYRSQHFQVNSHVNALAEIYTLHSSAPFAPLSKLNFRQKDAKRFLISLNYFFVCLLDSIFQLVEFCLKIDETLTFSDFANLKSSAWRLLLTAIPSGAATIPPEYVSTQPKRLRCFHFLKMFERR